MGNFSIAANTDFSTDSLYDLFIEDGKGWSFKFLDTFIFIYFTLFIKIDSSSLLNLMHYPIPLIESTSKSNLW